MAENLGSVDLSIANVAGKVATLMEAQQDVLALYLAHDAQPSPLSTYRVMPINGGFRARLHRLSSYLEGHNISWAGSEEVNREKPFEATSFRIGLDKEYSVISFHVNIPAIGLENDDPIRWADWMEQLRRQSREAIEYEPKRLRDYPHVGVPPIVTLFGENAEGAYTFGHGPDTAWSTLSLSTPEQLGNTEIFEYRSGEVVSHWAGGRVLERTAQQP